MISAPSDLNGLILLTYVGGRTYLTGVSPLEPFRELTTGLITLVSALVLPVTIAKFRALTKGVQIQFPHQANQIMINYVLAHLLRLLPFRVAHAIWHLSRNNLQVTTPLRTHPSKYSK